MGTIRSPVTALLVAVTCACLLRITEVGAVSTGIVGNSGKQGANCGDCHNGGTAPLVRLEGPDVVYAGALATFRFVVQPQSSRQQVAGFNLAASDGRLETLGGQGAHIEFGELTHDFPKPAAADETSWLFTWRAPETAGIETIFGAALSANGNNTRSGDEMALLTMTVTVSDEPRADDANCDDALSAADLSAIVRLSAAAEIGDCDLADANCDGAVDGADVGVLIGALFDSASVGPCLVTAERLTRQPWFSPTDHR